ncbi:MAG: hypothetical protein ACI8WT_003140 [Clostridium sp.]|jgi:hypothetical protein
MGKLTGIIDFLGTLIGISVKHPLVTKMLIFTTFVALIGASVTFLKGLVAPYIVSNNMLALAGYFGLLDGLSLFLTIIVAGFGVKQVLAFIRS